MGGKEGQLAIQALIARQTDLSGMENEVQMDSIYRGEAWRIIRAHPVQYGLLSAYRFFPLWFNLGYSEAYGKHTSREDYLIMVFQAVLLSLAVVGSRKNVERTWLLWGSVLALSLTYMVVISRLLYLIPVMPLVISLSAAGGINLFRKFRSLKLMRVS